MAQGHSCYLLIDRWSQIEPGRPAGPTDRLTTGEIDRWIGWSSLDSYPS